MKYLKIWTSFLQVIEPLQYDEIGRLFEMMLTYAERGTEPESFEGNERFLWPAAKQQIDLTAERNDILRANGMKGGRPKTKQNQTKPNETKQNQSEPNETCKEKKRKEKERKEKELSFINDDDARAAANDQQTVLDAAEDAGFLRSNSVRAKLIDLYAQHGLEKMLAAIDACVHHGVINLAYLEAVLKGEPKKPKETAKLPAQDYHQRDLSNAQEEAFDRMMAMEM